MNKLNDSNHGSSLNDSKSIVLAAGMSSGVLNEDQLGPVGNRRSKSYVIGQRYH